MTYVLFKDLIHTELQKHAAGKTWKELRSELTLPYDRPCPEWTRRLEREIGLIRGKGSGRELVWLVKSKRR